MNVWIVYDSKYGNNKQVAEALVGHFKDENTVHVHFAKEISQQAVIDGGVDMVIMGGPVHFGGPTSTMKKWTKKMTDILNKKTLKVRKVAIWSTHMKNDPNQRAGKCSWDVAKAKWNVILDTFPAEKKATEIQGIEVGAISGANILETGWQDLVARFAGVVKNL